jgi:hypothetical protein
MTGKSLPPCHGCFRVKIYGIWIGFARLWLKASPSDRKAISLKIEALERVLKVKVKGSPLPERFSVKVKRLPPLQWRF